MLNASLLVRQGAFTLHGDRWGSLTWRNLETGKERASVRYFADLNEPHAAFVRLVYSANDVPFDYSIRIHRTPCRFGGFRWSWQCPRTGHNAAKLYMPPGATMFLSRHAYRMAYRSERGGPTDRSHERQRRIYEKLGGEYRIFEQGPPKRPKGMHRRTYDRLVAQLYAAMATHNAIFMAGAARLLARDPSMWQELGL